jgi:hypothetical protein
MPLVLASGVPANSDYFPFVDLSAARTRILRQNAAEFSALQTLPVPFFELLEGNASSRTRTSPSPKPISARDHMGVDATELRDAIATWNYGKVSSDTARVLLTLNSSKENCGDPTVRRAWLDSAFYVGEQTNAALGASELQATWDTIGKTPCAGMLTGQDLQMLDLLRAVAARDMEKVTRVGSALLNGRYPFSEPAQMSFALLATASSAIGQHEPAMALEAIQTHGGKFSKSADVALALKWLAAIATEQSGPDATRVAQASAGS